MSLNRKEELDTGEKKAEKEESIGCTSSDEMCQSNIQQENAKEDDQVARPPLKYVYGRTGKPRISHLISQVENRNQLSNRNRHLQPSNLFSHSTSRHELHLEGQQRDPATITPEEIDKLNKEDEYTSFRVHFDYCFERRKRKMQTSSEVYKQSKLDKGKSQAQASSMFSQLTSRHKVQYLEGQHRDIKISPATITRDIVITPVEIASSKSASKKGRGRKSKAVTGRSSRSVPRQRKRKSTTPVQQDIQKIEDGDLNDRRRTYFLEKNEKTPSIFDQSPQEFDLVDTHIGYQESLLNFTKNLGPTAQSLASKKLKLLSLAQTTAHAFQAPVPHQSSSAWRLSEDPKGKSVIMDRGCGKKSVSAEDMRPMRPFDRVGSFSGGSACIASLPDASRIQRSTDVVHKSVGENVHFPTHNHDQLVLQQHHLSPSNTAVLNANDVHPGHQSTPLNELQTHDSHMQLQNQLGLGAYQQKMGIEQKSLPILSNMFDTETSSSVRNHQTTSNAGQSAQQLPLAHRSYTNLELQLRTKPLSPDEAN